MEKYFPEKLKQETQVCSEWREEIDENGKTVRTRSCEPKK
jgi:hypothetical protein